MIVDLDSLEKDALEHSRKGKFMTMGGSEIVEMVHSIRLLTDVNKRLKAACDIFEKNSADAVDMQKALWLIEDIACEVMCDCNHPSPEKKFCPTCEIYGIAHGFSTCHDECPVKKEGLRKAKEHPVRTQSEQTRAKIQKHWDEI